MSAMASREKRKTAGQRMTSLVGQAQEEDDAFWGHDTWVEDDSGNDSFRESDEESEMRKDEFDSDFDDSESDNEDEEAAAGEDEEKEIQKGERRSKKSHYVDIAKGGRALMQKAKGVKGSNRAVGNGINAGIVLNLPSVTTSLDITEEAVTIPTQPLATVPVPSLSTAAPSETTSSPPSPKKLRMSVELGVRPTLASARERRSQTRKRDSRNSTPTYSETASQANKKLKLQPSGTKKSRRRQYAQEELLLEAVKDTEQENQRWLLARKRVQESADQDKDATSALRDKHRGKNVIQKYHSRRGCLITLTFPEMDAVPEILTRKSEPPTPPQPLTCTITGKPARYRDPKTSRGYFDAAAFKELRRRFNAGESLDQRPRPKPKPKKEEPQPTVSNGSSEPKPPNTQQPKSPSSTAFVVDLGGAQKSPGGTRSSGRKWKPSEKMIQGLGLKREGSSSVENNSTAKVSDTILGSPPLLPSMTPSAKVEAGNLDSSTAHPSVKSKEPPAKVELGSITLSMPSTTSATSCKPLALTISGTNGKAENKDSRQSSKQKAATVDAKIASKPGTNIAAASGASKSENAIQSSRTKAVTADFKVAIKPANKTTAASAASKARNLSQLPKAKVVTSDNKVAMETVNNTTDVSKATKAKNALISKVLTSDTKGALQPVNNTTVVSGASKARNATQSSKAKVVTTGTKVVQQSVKKETNTPGASKARNAPQSSKAKVVTTGTKVVQQPVKKETDTPGASKAKNAPQSSKAKVVQQPAKKTRGTPGASKAKNASQSSKGEVVATGAQVVQQPTKKTTAISVGSKANSEIVGTSVPQGVTLSPTEQVYVIPGDGENGFPEPRYVTQSELIMQAISNYSRSHQQAVAPISSDNRSNAEKHASNK